MHIGGRLGRLPAKDLLQDVLELLLDYLEEPSLKRRELLVNGSLMLEQERQDEFLVDDRGSLGGVIRVRTGFPSWPNYKYHT